MARYQLAATPRGVIQDRRGDVRGNKIATLTQLDGTTPVTIYSAETGSTKVDPTAGKTYTDDRGELQGWIDLPGDYLLTVDGRTLRFGVPPLSVESVYTVTADRTGNADASAAIQAKIDRAYADGGGIVSIPSGVFKITMGSLDGFQQGQCIYVRNGVTLRGAGKDATRLVLAGTVASGGRYWPIRVGLRNEAATGVLIEDLTVDSETAALASAGSVFPIGARHDNDSIALHSDDIEVRNCRVIGGAIGIGCTKEGNADFAAGTTRLGQQYQNWRVHHNEIIRTTNKASELAECNGGFISYNVIDRCTDGPQAIFSSRHVVIEQNRGTFMASGVNITQGVTDFKVLYNDLRAADDAPTATNRGALAIRCEDQAVTSTIARGIVRGNTFADAVKTGSRVLAFQSRASTTAVTVQDVVFEDNYFAGSVDFYDILTPTPSSPKTTVQGITWGKGNRVTGSINTNTAVTIYGQSGADMVVPKQVPSQAASAAWPTANQMRCGIFDLDGLATVRYFRVNVGLQSGNIQVGIVRFTSDLDYVRVAHSGVIACPAVGDQVIDLGAAVTLQPGRYGLFFWADNATVQIPLLTNSPSQPLKTWGVHSGLASGVQASGTMSAYSNRLFPAAASLAA